MEKITNNDLPAQSPGDNLAEQLYDKLLAEGLVIPYGKYVFIQQLAHGELKESHWRTALNQAINHQYAADETQND